MSGPNKNATLGRGIVRKLKSFEVLRESGSQEDYNLKVDILALDDAGDLYLGEIGIAPDTQGEGVAVHWTPVMDA